MDISKTLSDLERNQKYNKIETFRPYEYQKRFYSLKDKNGKVAKGRVLMAANQIGKTLSEGVEVSYHATGRYPEWWEGHRVNRDPLMICGGKNAYTTRDLIQKELLGTSDKDDGDNVGTGWIPKKDIHKLDRKPGIPGACEKITVKRNNGMELAEISLLGYEDGAGKFMGKRIDYGWNDEEPPMDIFSQMKRGTIATGGVLAVTFTPEDGMTEFAHWIINECPDNYALIKASWDDAPHITKERREELLAEMHPSEREMRSKGEPVVGAAMIFPVPDDQISITPFEIPDSWYQIMAIDFGGDHPFAVGKIAIDPSGTRKKAYLIDCEKHRRLTISQEASIIRGMGGDKLPVAWPHDGNKNDKQSGKTIAQLYRDEGVNLLHDHFTNPPDTGKYEGTGGIGIDAGLKKMFWAMTEGRFKVFSHLHEWFAEKGAYHKKDGKVVALNDDLMSMTRYGYMSALDSEDKIRYAKRLGHDQDFSRKIQYDLSQFK